MKKHFSVNLHQVSFLKSGKFRRLILITLLVLAVLLLLSFFLRNAIFHFYLDKYVNRFNKAYHAGLCIQQAHIRGITSLEVQGISLKPERGDTLLSIDSVYASIGFWKLLAGRITLNNLELKNTLLHFVKHDSLNNYMFLLDRKSGKPVTGDPPKTKNFAARMTGILETAFDKVPDDLLIYNFVVTSDYNDHLLEMAVDTFRLQDHHFASPIRVTEDQSVTVWQVSGKLDKYRHEARFCLSGNHGQTLSLPFVRYKWKSEVQFDSLRFSLMEKETGSKLVVVSGNVSLQGLKVNHPRLASEPVAFGKSAFDYTINIGQDYVEVDSLTTVEYDQLSFHPFLKYRVKPFRQLTFRIDKKDFPAQELFSSLPPGLFHNLQGLKTRGNLSFHLLLDVNLNLPDSLLFECELHPRNFAVLSYGNTRFTLLNDTFTQVAYEKGEPSRTFLVGPPNPNFRPLDQISPYLRNSILNSEDGAFFQHRGFLIEAFRQSIATNIKQRRFARGGSTITMQLVKNVFLNRNKTMARKMEEVIIVWLIENLQLVSKERMYEVYLNIIEWGPGIYGAQEASKFYFNKDAGSLSYAEAIYLASIIPRPKYFMHTFDKNTGQLKDYLRDFFLRMAEKMLKKEMITQEDFDLLKPEIELKGPAKNLLLKPDSVPEPDSLFFLPPDFPE